MRKKLRLIILIVIIIAQICVPVGMVVHKNVSIISAREKGEKYKFNLKSVTYSDGYVDFSVDYPYVSGGNYAALEKDENGYAVFTMLVNKPKENNYIKSGYYGGFSFPVTGIETEKFKNITDRIWLCSWNDLGDIYSAEDDWVCYNESYLEGYVYKGTVVADSVYIDGVEIDEFLKELNNNLAVSYQGG